MGSVSTSKYIPWNWAITPADSQIDHCPSVHHTIIVYLLATILTTFIGLLAGSRTIVRISTCGLLGRKDSISWAFMWLLQFGFHFGADVIVAYLVTSAEGYQHDRMPKIGDLALFYTSRPRMAWIALGALGATSEWNSAAKQTMIVETVMQLIGCYYLGRTADFAAKNSFYSSHGYSHWAQLMYGSALFILIMTALSIYGLTVSLASLATTTDSKEDQTKAYFTKLGGALVMVFCGFFAFAGRWLFLVGYLKLAGEA